MINIKKIKKISILCLVAILSLVALVGCSGGDGSKDESKGVIKISYPNWVEGIAMTNLSKVILEEKMGYEVDIDMADIGVIYTSLADGSTDFLLDAWLPVFHKDYMAKYKDDLVDLGKNFDNSTVGIAVPSYVKANSIEDLEKYKSEFDGKVIGIDSGANVNKTVEEAIKEYNLDYELVKGSEPVMLASLGDAIENKESIAVIGWKPHWKFAKWDLKFLEDPKNFFGEAESLHTIARKDIKEDLPEVAEFFENFHFTDEQLSDLILTLENGGDDKLVSSKKWMEDNEELVNSWIPKNK